MHGLATVGIRRCLGGRHLIGLGVDDLGSRETADRRKGTRGPGQPRGAKHASGQLPEHADEANLGKEENLDERGNILCF